MTPERFYFVLISHAAQLERQREIIWHNDGSIAWTRFDYRGHDAVFNVIAVENTPDLYSIHLIIEGYQIGATDGISGSYDWVEPLSQIPDSVLVLMELLMSDCG